ncbi:unnamed protein product [Polarella glacialis]|uniref:Uncharacterized protein n=1 Tax=Polarella glacialis TaxID=89957 RepID=A0A813HFA2_POLGL|nr:unnamed protein product [Polarella glacialis]
MPTRESKNFQAVSMASLFLLRRQQLCCDVQFFLALSAAFCNIIVIDSRGLAAAFCVNLGACAPADVGTETPVQHNSSEQESRAQSTTRSAGRNKSSKSGSAARQGATGWMSPNALTQCLDDPRHQRGEGSRGAEPRRSTAQEPAGRADLLSEEFKLQVARGNAKAAILR